MALLLLNRLLEVLNQHEQISQWVCGIFVLFLVVAIAVFDILKLENWGAPRSGASTCASQRLILADFSGRYWWALASRCSG